VGKTTHRQTKRTVAGVAVVAAAAEAAAAVVRLQLLRHLRAPTAAPAAARCSGQEAPWHRAVEGGGLHRVRKCSMRASGLLIGTPGTRGVTLWTGRNPGLLRRAMKRACCACIVAPSAAAAGARSMPFLGNSTTGPLACRVKHWSCRHNTTGIEGCAGRGPQKGAGPRLEVGHETRAMWSLPGRNTCAAMHDVPCAWERSIVEARGL
jgi:hypothetical protein